MPSCPACGRGVAVARASCLYCGSPLARAEPVAPARAAEEPSRVLVLLDLAATSAEALAAALALSGYEAGLLARRGGVHLVRAGAEREALAEAERLRANGASPWLVPESEVRAAPLACVSGERRGGELLLRTASGTEAFPGADALLVVRGTIAREYQSSDEPRRIATARPAEGARVHLHRRGAARALEIDVLNFEVGFAARGGALLEVEEWLAALRGVVPLDSGFARHPPALAPAQPAAFGALSAFDSLAASRGDSEGRVVLDNVAQFRFYSGCLAAVARRRTPGGLGGATHPPE